VNERDKRLDETGEIDQDQLLYTITMHPHYEAFYLDQGESGDGGSLEAVFPWKWSPDGGIKG
jgi:hypothetical protein